LATLILDTNVGEPWIDAIAQFEAKIGAIKARGRVKASKDLGDVAQALRIVVSVLFELYCKNNLRYVVDHRWPQNYGHF
jgi:hypothetical protein